jgi:hypothetical protein
MELKEMKAFAALTDEERARAIRREEARLKAIEEWANERYRPDSSTSYKPDCGCGDPFWTLNREGQQEVNICFRSDGTITSDVWEMIEMSHMYCLHCGAAPSVPQSYIDEYIEREE